MRMRITLLLALLTCLALLGTAPSAFAAQQAPRAPDAFKNIAVTGTTDSGGSFEGTFDINRFSRSGGTLYAVGRLTGVVTDSSGTRPATKLVRLPVETGGAARV